MPGAPSALPRRCHIQIRRTDTSALFHTTPPNWTAMQRSFFCACSAHLYPAYEGLLGVARKSTLLIVGKGDGFRHASFTNIRHGHHARVLLSFCRRRCAGIQAIGDALARAFGPVERKRIGRHRATRRSGATGGCADSVSASGRKIKTWPPDQSATSTGFFARALCRMAPRVNAMSTDSSGVAPVH
jgi:hypothetical protein